MSHFGSGRAQARAAGRKRARAGIAVAVIAGAVLISGCARQPAHEAHAHAGGVCSADRPQPEPLPAPDCEFKAITQNSVDASELARLKLAYERQCFQRAEKAARERLRELQASRACDGRGPARRQGTL